MRTAIMLASIVILAAIRPSSLNDGSWPMLWRILIPAWIGVSIVLDFADYIVTIKRIYKE
jgi:hypothetical protein